jgi:cation/acetate symporter
MDQTTLNIIVVGLSFALYFGIAIWARAGSTSEFYAAGRGVNPVINGMATAADWMSAASFISMAGLIAFVGYNNSLFLMGWTGGYVLWPCCSPRTCGSSASTPFPSSSATGSTRTPHASWRSSAHRHLGHLRDRPDDRRGRGLLPLPRGGNSTGLYIASAVVFAYAVLGGMKGITYTQVAQYCVLIVAYTIPAIFISLQLTGNPIPGWACSRTCRKACRVASRRVFRC